MKRLEMTILSEATNAAVLVVPGRRFPGIVLQGDSLSVLVSTTKAALEALRAGRAEDAADELTELAELLDAYQNEYERALGEAGFELPYPQCE